MAASSLSSGAGSSVITSGVRRIGAWIEIGGAMIPIEKGSATQNRQSKSSEFKATFGLDGLPQGIDEAYLANSTPLPAKIHVATQPNGGDDTVLVDGQIDDVDIDYVTRTVSVDGRCKSADLHSTKTSAKFQNQKGSDIVSTVAASVGLMAVVDASLLLAGKLFQIDVTKMTDGISLAALMHKLAEFDGAHWHVKGSQLFYKQAAPDSSGGSYVVTYTPPSGGYAQGDFLRLTVKRRVPLSKDIAVTHSAWNTKEKKVHTSTKVVKGQGGTTRYAYKNQELTKDRTDQHAAAAAADHARHEIELSVEMAGDPSIDITQKLTLRGTAFAQDYDMDQIHHEFGYGAGYTMAIAAKSARSGRQVSDGTDTGPGAGDE
jgi:phage protein D